MPNNPEDLTVSESHSLRAQEDKDGLIQRADAALYQAKAGGRNRVVADAS